MTDISGPSVPAQLIDGGDRACGELLLVLAARARSVPAGTLLRLIASDPAAELDLPAWCHLTGHEYRGGHRQDGRSCYDILTSRSARATRDGAAWRIETAHHPHEQPTERTHP